MKTDYDFIKEKFEQSEVNAPESLNENFILDKIKDTKPAKKKSGLWTGLYAAAAVAVFTVAAFAIIAVVGNSPKTVTDGTNINAANLSSFSSIDDVKKAVDEIRKEQNKYNKNTSAGYELGAAENSTSTDGELTNNSSDNDFNSTYTQYSDVDEADEIKTDGKYIYYLTDAGTITIFTAEGKNSRKVAEIKIDKGPYGVAMFEEFYINNSKLIAIESVTRYINISRTNTRIETFDISNIKEIKLIDSFTQSGGYRSSRITGGKLYMVSTHNSSGKNDLPFIRKGKAATDDESKNDILSPKDIYSADDPSVANFMVISEFDLAKNSLNGTTKAILGSADTVYCNGDHIYVTATEYEYKFDKMGSAVAAFFPSVKSTQIIKIDLTNGIKFSAASKVKGYVDSQYSMSEKDGYLRVAATSDSIEKGDENKVNLVYIFDNYLKKTGKTEEFGIGESIKAVRYIDNTAYVVTYKDTDPLFVIDVSDAKNPKLLGKVKINGFSKLLVPFDDNTLLGIGNDTAAVKSESDAEVIDGIKLALFDISDKKNPKVIDEKVFKNYGSAVQLDPKALLVNKKRNDYTIPYNKYDESNDTKDDYGIINFKVDNGKIKIVDEYKSDKFFNSADESNILNRCVYAGDYIYMLGTHSDHNDKVKNDNSSAVIDAVQYK